VALHARVAKRQRILEAGSKRQLPLRAVLLILALVPSVAMVGLWAVNSSQLYDNWRSVRDHNAATVRATPAVAAVSYNLQTERWLSAAALADPADYQAKLTQQRRITDMSVSSLGALTGTAPADLDNSIRQISQGMQRLADYRSAVDRRTATQQQVYDDYTGQIASDLQLFSAVSNTGLADVNYLVRPLIDSVWGSEMISRENAWQDETAIQRQLAS